jgi:ABC-type sugar transport system ATPase subunit
VPTTSIYVTHDQVEAMTLGDRIVVMRDGLVQQVGSPLELYRRPRNKFVAGFIGSPAMNFFEVAVEAMGDKLVARAPGIEIALTGAVGQRLKPYVGRSVTVGVRPEHIALGERQAADDITLEVPVLVTEQLGSEQLLDVRLGAALLRSTRRSRFAAARRSASVSASSRCTSSTPRPRPLSPSALCAGVPTPPCVLLSYPIRKTQGGQTAPGRKLL